LKDFVDIRFLLSEMQMRLYFVADGAQEGVFNQRVNDAVQVTEQSAWGRIEAIG
jgi:hypothetical protein